MPENELEELPNLRPGNKVLRRPVKHHRRLRAVPHIPAILRVAHDIITKTPFLPMFLTLVILWLVFALGMYLLERNAAGAEMTTYNEALWWALATVETMGTPYKPVTSGGHVLGAIWAILGTMVFWGTIIASVTVYFTNRRKTSLSRIIDTIHYDLDELESLKLEELEALKINTNRVIDVRIEKVKSVRASTKTEN